MDTHLHLRDPPQSLCRASMCLALMASPGENAELGTDNSNFLTWNNPSTFKKKKLILPSPWTPAGLGPFAGLRGGLVPCCRGCAPSRGGRPPVRGVWLAPRGPRDRPAHLEPQWGETASGPPIRSDDTAAHEPGQLLHCAGQGAERPGGARGSSGPARRAWCPGSRGRRQGPDQG